MGLYRCTTGVVKSVQNFGRGRPVGVRVAPARWLVGVARDFMNITFTCATCGTSLRSPAAQAGKRVKCPDCLEVQFVPTDEAGVDGNGFSGGETSAKSKTPPNADQDSAMPDEVLCPICWLVSDLGELMHISEAEALEGDLIPGAPEDQQLRFLATRFNDLGQAIDPSSGHPCSDLACPHCHRKLPSGYLDTPHRIISLVGDLQAGKSYYLAVLAKMLPATLFRYFNVSLQDGDPQGNAMLNLNRGTLFGAKTRAETWIKKTQESENMYETVLRRGKQVKLPRPFTYLLGATDPSREQASLIFYDNSGENFQAATDINTKPGAQHVASASGLLFLFDPFYSSEFRQRIADSKDPQIAELIVDMQDVILSTMRSNIQQLRHLKSTDKVETPLAMLIGKCDAWMHLLGENAFQNPVREGWLDFTALEHNSKRIRSLLMDICPSVVGNAESLSKDVLYFPVSSFGHTPIKTPVAGGRLTVALPEPTLLKPIFVEVPVLWLLSKFCPQFVPVRSASP